MIYSFDPPIYLFQHIKICALTIQIEHGKWGEAVAVKFLEVSGLRILERNWRYKRAEIDIIAKEGEILVFIEVKTRANTSFGLPEEMVSKFKQRLVIDAAMAFMRSIGHEWEIRFDIIAIQGTPGSEPEIRHFRDAYFPGLDYH